MTPTITLIDTTRLKPNPNNPRKNIGDITALADSIRAHGIQQELVVTPIADSTDYRVVIGHRSSPPPNRPDSHRYHAGSWNSRPRTNASSWSSRTRNATT